MKALFIFATLFTGEPDINVFTTVMDADKCAIHAAKLESQRDRRRKAGWTHMTIRCEPLSVPAQSQEQKP